MTEDNGSSSSRRACGGCFVATMRYTATTWYLAIPWRTERKDLGFRGGGHDSKSVNIRPLLARGRGLCTPSLMRFSSIPGRSWAVSAVSCCVICAEGPIIARQGRRQRGGSAPFLFAGPGIYVKREKVEGQKDSLRGRGRRGEKARFPGGIESILVRI